MASDDKQGIPPESPAVLTSPEESAAVPPMNAQLMSKLFIVPALIVCLLLAVAVVVVLFGTTTTDKPVTVDDLLTRIQQDDGERTMGMMLMPKAKESWQASQELARRFEQRDRFLKPEEIEPTAEKIIGLLAKYPPGRKVDESGPAQQYFLMIALARLETASGVAPLVGLLADENWWTRRTALQALADMKNVPEARRALGSILPLLEDPEPAVQIVACATVACLADVDDTSAVRALRERLETGASEVQWNAAMALARLGSRAGKLTLLNMLDRGYWEGLDLQYAESGSLVQRKYTEAEVERNLRATIEAVSGLDDRDLTKAITTLRQDRSILVRDAAYSALGETGPADAPATTVQGGSSMSSPRQAAVGEDS